MCRFALTNYKFMSSSESSVHQNTTRCTSRTVFSNARTSIMNQRTIDVPLPPPHRVHQELPSRRGFSPKTISIPIGIRSPNWIWLSRRGFPIDLDNGKALSLQLVTVGQRTISHWTVFRLTAICG